MAPVVRFIFIILMETLLLLHLYGHLIIPMIFLDALPLCQWAVTGYSVHYYSVNTLFQSAEEFAPYLSALCPA